MIYTKEELTEMVHRLQARLEELEMKVNEDRDFTEFHADIQRGHTRKLDYMQERIDELTEIDRSQEKRLVNMQMRARTLLNDNEIATLAMEEEMIQPFHGDQINQLRDQRLLSFGLSSFGYDIRLSDRLLVMDETNIPEYEEDFIIDPKNIDSRVFTEVKAGKDGGILLPPYGFALGESVEYFKMPPDVLGLALGKSTYARSGILVNMVTPLEPGWSGSLTLEIFNATPFWSKVYVGEGISQIVFLKGNSPMVTYDSRKGKYMEQEGIVLPRV